MSYIMSVASDLAKNLFSEKSGCWPSWSEATGALDRVGQEVKDAITFVRIP